MTQGDLRTVVEVRGAATVLRLSGELTSLTEKSLMEAYAGLDLNSGARLVIDFRETRYINSAGIAALVGLVADISRRNGSLAFSGLQPHYQRVMQIVGITNYVKLYDATDAAVAALAEG